MAEGFVLNISADIDSFIAKASRVEKDQIPFVTAYALTKTAQDIKGEMITVMARVFDRPTRFTLNALYVKPATKQDLTAAVLFKEDGFKTVPAWKYLGPEVEGGTRAHKSHELRLIRAGIMRKDEFAVPGQGAPLDRYGNLPGGAIERILSQLGAAEQWAGYTANATKKTLAKAKRKGIGRYFVLRGTAARDGIYHRLTGTTIKPVIIFVKQPRYQKRLPYYEIARQVFKASFPKHFRIGMITYAR